MAAKTKKRKQREPWGRIRSTSSGRLQASYQGPDLAVHNGPTTFETLQDARAWLHAEHALVAAHLNGGAEWLSPKAREVAKVAREEADAAGSITLREYARQALALRDLKSTTKTDYHKLLDRYVLPELGDVPVRDIDSGRVRQWWGNRDVKLGRSNAKAYVLLRSIFNDAVEDGSLPVAVNPCNIKDAAKVKAAAKAPEATLEEVAVMVDAMPDRLRCVVLLASWCSLRYAEIVALQRRDIDLAAKAVRVQRNATWDGSLESTPKTASSNRLVHVPSNVWPEIVRHLDEHTGKERAALLFPPAGGAGYLRESVFYRGYWKAAREAAGRPDLRFHDLRGTGATWAAQAGVPLLEIQNRLGHSTPDATLIYLRKARDGGRTAAAQLAALADPGPRLKVLPGGAQVPEELEAVAE